MRKSLLITGGLGNLGSWITEHLQNEFDVTVLSKRDRTLTFQKNYEIIFADLADRSELLDTLSGRAFDYVVHAASVNDAFVDGYETISYDVNAFGTRNLINALDTLELKHFIYLSTFQVYGNSNGLITEATIERPKNDYGLSHFFAEQFLRMHLPKNSFSIIRLTNSYGCPRDRDTSKWYLALNDLSRQAYEEGQLTLLGNGKALRDFIWMGDVVRTLHGLLLTEPANEVFNLSSEKSVSILEMAKLVQAAFEDWSGKIIKIKINENDDHQPDLSFCVSSAKLKRVTKIGNADMIATEAKAIFQLLKGA